MNLQTIQQQIQHLQKEVQRYHKPEPKDKLMISISINNLNKIFTQLRNEYPELRGFTTSQIVNIAFYKFCINRNIQIQPPRAKNRTQATQMQKAIKTFKGLTITQATIKGLPHFSHILNSYYEENANIAQKYA